MITPKKVVILGGGYAGVNAALRLKLRNHAADITMVNERPEFVERIRNHECAAGTPQRRLSLPRILGPDIRFVQGRAHKIDIVTRSVLVDSTVIPYDILVYALGSGARDQKKEGMHSINTREEAESLKRTLAAKREHRVLILGAGLTGLELATEIRNYDPKRVVTLLDRREPGSHLSERARRYLHQTLAELHIGFELLTADPFAAKTYQKDLAKGDSLLVDCTGFTCPDLARQSGLRCDDKNRIFVNEFLQAEGHEEILVAGDAAAYGFGTARIPYSGCASAMPMGTHAGETAARLLAGKNPQAFRHGFTFQCISLGRKRGIIQFLDKFSGKPTGVVLTGKTAALFKELICRLTVLLPKLERKTRWPFYTWRKTRILHRLADIASKAA